MGALIVCAADTVTAGGTPGGFGLICPAYYLECQRSAISWVRRSMWPSALLSAALLLEEISLAISCCILSMERIMSPNIFSHSCSALCAECCTGNMEVCNKSTVTHKDFTNTLREAVITPT
ncbi:hypothetical protein INR49_015039 [Caranx melampygus]|nr:hypothetical protein INR49_015039 [Caranx melampygus]